MKADLRTLGQLYTRITLFEQQHAAFQGDVNKQIKRLESQKIEMQQFIDLLRNQQSTFDCHSAVAREIRILQDKVFNEMLQVSNQFLVQSIQSRQEAGGGDGGSKRGRDGGDDGRDRRRPDNNQRGDGGTS